MPERNCIRTKLIFAVAIVVLVVGLMPLPAFAVLADESAVSVIGNVAWDDGNNKKNSRPEKITVHLFANGTESQSLTFGMGESGQWLFTFNAVPILDSEGKKIVYTVSVEEISEYTTDVTKEGNYAFSITNTLNVSPEQKTAAKVTEAPKAGTLAYNGIWQALVSAGSTEDGQMMYALGADSVTVPSKESFGVRPSIGKNAGEYYVWYYVKGDAFHTDSAPVCVSATIGKLPATITVESASKDQGEKDPEFTGTVTGLIAEGDLGEVVFVRTSDEEAPGTYKGVLSAEYEANPNYDVEVVKGDFTIKKLPTVVWLDGDGNVLQEKTYGKGEKPPAYDGKTPTKTATAQYTYTFTGWDSGTVDGVTTTYRSLFSETVNKYKVTFVDYDGSTVLKEATEYRYGTPASNVERPADPTRKPNAKYTYTFSGWTPEVADVTEDATYTATYTETAKKGTLTFDLGGGTIDGKTSLTIEANVGDVITIPEAPVRAGYTFKYWKGSKYYPGDKYTVQGDHAFTAVWEKKPDNGGGSGSTSDKRSVSSNTPGKSSIPKTGDELGGTIAVFGAMAASAFCLAVFARCKN